jgi:hypothetical protein
MEGYENSLGHLLEELRRIDLLIRLRVLEFQTKGQGTLDEFRGLCIQEEEIDALLAETDPLQAKMEIEPSQLKLHLDHLAALEARIAEKKVASLREGIVLRLERLKELFQLSSFEVDALLICLAPELDLRYEKLYAYLQDDVTKKRPSIGLVLDLLSPSFEAKLAARQAFAPTAPLSGIAFSPYSPKSRSGIPRF